jgi:hypothetical protein
MLSEDEYILIVLFMIPVVILICICVNSIRRVYNLEERELEALIIQP